MSARILLIEDNGPNLELMSYLLRSQGHAPTGVTDAVDGVRAAQEGEYDLVVTDILMPGMDGYALLKRLRANPRLANTKVVAVTALAMVGDRERILSAGFDGYLAKPIEPETFVRDLEAFLSTKERPQAQPQFGRDTSAVEPVTADGRTILVVDDIAVNRELIRSALSPLGYRVVEARDTAEAREKLRTDTPALILCDVHMPGGTGLEFAAELKSDPAHRSTPFLFISSTVWRAAERQRASELGAGELVLRPIDPGKLQREVMRVLQASARAEDSHS
jgi:two-component system cell cycle response regulator